MEAYKTGILPVSSTVKEADVSVHKLDSSINISDPLSLQNRPSENAVQKAREKLRSAKGKDNVVKFGHLGYFEENMMVALENFCLAATTKREIDSEKNYFQLINNKYSISKAEIDKIADIVWHRHVLFNVTKVERMDIKVNHLICFPAERNLNDQVVDAVIYKLWNKCPQKESTLCLPMYCFDMLSRSIAGDANVKNSLVQLIKARLPTDAKQVLIPVNVAKCH